MSRNHRKIMPVLEKAKDMLDYDPDTGVFTWKKQTASNKQFLVGTEAGTISKAGYKLIVLDGVQLRAHRLAWAMFYNEEPPADVDHVNQDKADNRIENLRDGTEGVNQRNVSTRKNNKLGVTGVCYETARGRILATRRPKSHLLGQGLL